MRIVQKLPLDELTTVIARIQGLLLSEEKVDAAVQRLAQGIKDVVPGTLGAGVSLLDSRGRRTSSGSTDEIVTAADALQYELGSGPCLTAWASEKTVIVDDARTDPRWPEWGRAVADLPVRSVVSAPLLGSRECIGALKIYSDQPGSYDGEAARVLELFAAPAATLLEHIQTKEAPQRISESLATSLGSRDTVNRACGILMERHGLGADAAMRELMRRAREQKTTLHGVSDHLINGTPAERN